MGKKLERIIVLSIWDTLWSLGEGCGVPDEIFFIEGLRRKGISIDYLMPEPPSAGAPSIEGVSFHTYRNVFREHEKAPRPVSRFWLPVLHSQTVISALRRLIMQSPPDLMLGYSYLAFRPMSILGRELGIPSVVKLFGVMYLNRRELPPHRYWWLNYEQIFSLKYPVDHYLVLNDGTQGKEALIGRGIPAGKITFLPNGMDMGWAGIEIDREKMREDLGLPGDKILLVTVSRLTRSKRIELFLESAAKIPPGSLERCAIVIGGDGPDRRKLEAQAARLGLRDKVIFTGAVKYGDVPLLLKSCDIFVGTNELTNMSMPPCEALLCGLPVVAFDTAGTSEVIRDGENGILVAHRDTESLAKGIDMLIRDPGMRMKLGKEAKESALREFMSWDERTSREIAVLEETASARR